MISRAIRKMEKSLEWDLKITTGTGRCETISEPENTAHHIFVPNHDPTGGLGYLHELCHAHLTEKIHPLFGGILFAKGTEKQQVVDVRMAMNCACDWYVEELEHALAPAPLAREIEWHLERLPQMRYQPIPKAEILCQEAFILAQAERYLGRSAPSDETVALMVQAFHATDPTQPSVESVTRLVNKLMPFLQEAIGRGWQLEWVQDGEVQAWRVLP